MKEIPMLFSGPMVPPIKSRQKTETRRDRNLKEINENPDKWVLESVNGINWFFRNTENKNLLPIRCPYGKVGDVIWVRETFADGYNGSLDQNIGKPESEWTNKYWTFKDGSQIYLSGQYFDSNQTGTEPGFSHIKWRPSIHMPRAAARIFLEIKELRVERLQDITEEAAIAEGIHKLPDRNTYLDYSKKKMPMQNVFINPIDSYKSLWESINGDGSWDLNPWVIVIGFQKIDNYGAK